MSATLALLPDDQVQFLSASKAPAVSDTVSNVLPVETLAFTRGTEVNPGYTDSGDLNTTYNDGVFKERSRRFAAKLVPLKRQITVNDLGVAVQEWEGFVTSIGHSAFEARLLDRTRNMTVDTEFAEIPIDRVDDGDRELLRVGGIFYLTIRKRVLITGRHSIETRIVFRRLPAWHASALERADKEAEELAEFFSSGDDNESGTGF